MNNNTVFINVVNRESAQKRDSYIHRNGKKMNKTKASGAATTFSPSVSRSKGKLNTGLWELEVNPYYAETKEDQANLRLPAEWRDSDIYTRKNITRQELLEIKHGRKPGFYSSEKAPMLPSQRKGWNPTYLQSFVYLLNDGITVLDLDDPKDEIMYYLSLASSKIANNIESITPYTDFYISQVNESSERKATKRRFARKAMGALVDLIDNKGMILAEKVAVILKVVKGTVTNATVENALDEFITHPKENQKKKNIEEFLNVYELLGTKLGKDRFNAMFFLQTLINDKIISSQRGKHIWHTAPSEDLKQIGRSYKETIEWFLDPDAKDYHKMLKDQQLAKKELI